MTPEVIFKYYISSVPIFAPIVIMAEKLVSCGTDVFISFELGDFGVWIFNFERNGISS